LGKTSLVTLRVIFGLVAAFRAVFIYGEVAAAETWQPQLPRGREEVRALPPASVVIRA
jgi:hypothetical protein